MAADRVDWIGRNFAAIVFASKTSVARERPCRGIGPLFWLPSYAPDRSLRLTKAMAQRRPQILAQPAPTPAAARQELELWSKVRDSNSPAEIESFLAAFPNGRLAPIARERLKALREKAPAQPPGGSVPRVDFNPATVRSAATAQQPKHRPAYRRQSGIARA